MSRGVGADLEGCGNGRVGSALHQESRHLGFPWREAVLDLEVLKAAALRPVAAVLHSGVVMLLKLISKAPHPMEGQADLVDESSAILLQNRKGR
jgi:hypothetical protein